MEREAKGGRLRALVLAQLVEQLHLVSAKGIQKLFKLNSGCVAVGTAIAPETRIPTIESSHGQIQFTINYH